MKKFQLKPSFEFIFSLSLIAVMALPPIVFGQNQKELDITIRNGDTTINGRNIKDLSAMDRKQALKDINSVSVNGNTRGAMVPHRELMTNDRQRVIIQKRMDDHMQPMADNRRMTDSAHYTFRYLFRNGDGRDSAMTFNFNNRSMPGGDIRVREFGRRDLNRRNTQNFNFSNTDASGIMTHLSITVYDPRDEELKKIAGTDKNNLELRDLAMVPQFSEGKIVLLFDLPSKTTADVKMMDSEGKILWSEKAFSGVFKKSFSLGLNGIYYLEVKQAGKFAQKKIIKEE